MRRSDLSSLGLGSGPFAWKVTGESQDQLRLLLQKAVSFPFDSLRVRGGPTASLQLKRLVGSYGAPLTAADGQDVFVSFDGFDRYWMKIFFRRDPYEPELYNFLKRIRAIDQYGLIDGGANIGFWSAILTGSRFRISKALAVEASPETLRQLGRTARLCSGRFTVVPMALSSKPGTVTFDVSLIAASRKIVAFEEKGRTTTVPATTVDALVNEHGLDPSRLIVKLDVEGAEFECLLGADAAYRAGALFIYEDHGKDLESKLTASMLAHGAFCWTINPDGTLTRVTAAEQASAIKLDRGYGYNFVCTSGTIPDAAQLPLTLFGAA